MELVSKYVREQKRYAKNELKHLFEFDESGIEKFLKTLKSYGIIKCVDNNNKQLEMTDLLDEDIEIKDVTADNGDCLYVFTYVGIITIGNRIIKVYPKYILAENTEPIAAIFYVGAYTTVQPGYGDQYNNEAIAGCVMGGTSMAGGLASIGGTVIGVLIISLLQQGILALGFSKDYQFIITGIIVIAAVYADVSARRRKN